MSRNDPAFLFYPGDASEDTQHMNRLERGAYFDILKAQKRFSKFSFEQIKKILGNDFDTVWPTLKMCLTYEEDMFFISWVHNSIEKRREYSASRANNRKSVKTGEKAPISSSHVEHMSNISSSYVEHMGNGNGNINTIVTNEEEGVQGEEETISSGPKIDTGAKVLIVPELKGIWTKHRRTYQFEMLKDAQPLRLIGEAIAKGENVSAYELPGIQRIKETFEAVVVWSLTHNLYKNFQLSQFEKYFQTICENFRNSNGDAQGTPVGNNPGPKNGGGSVVLNNIEAGQKAAEIIKRKYSQVQ
jgi:hypothetical protein